MSDAGPEGVNVGNIAGFQKEMIAGGLSANAGLNMLREAGGSMGRTAWLRSWGEVRAALGGREQIGMLEPTLPPDEGSFTDWSAGSSGTRAYQVEVLTRDVGTDLVSRVPYTLLTDQVLSPADAEEAALAEYDANTDTGQSGEGQVVLGGVLVGLYRMTGSGAA